MLENGIFHDSADLKGDAKLDAIVDLLTVEIADVMYQHNFREQVKKQTACLHLGLLNFVLDTAVRGLRDFTDIGSDELSCKVRENLNSLTQLQQDVTSLLAELTAGGQEESL